MTPAERGELRDAINGRMRALLGVAEPPAHNLTGYVRHRCRCAICRAAHTACNRRYLDRLRQRREAEALGAS